jgi:hypothetical protein
MVLAPRCIPGGRLLALEETMFFRPSLRAGKLLALAGFTLALAACGGSNSTTPVTSPVTTTFPTTYSMLQTLNPPKITSLGFDIGFVDENLHQYFLADKATNGVDVVNTLTSAFLGTAGAGAFQGAGVSVPAFVAAGARSPDGGPNGVVSLGGGLVAAGDGNSTLKIVAAAPNISSAVVANISVPNPYTGPALGPGICAPQPAGPGQPDLGTPTVGAANNRVDEMAYDPTDNIIAAVSDNACPVFITFFQGTAPYNIIGQVALKTADAGGEQTVWDPGQHLFLMNVPATTVNPGGEIDTFSPSNLNQVNSVIKFPMPCGGSGLALGVNEIMDSACGGNSLTGNTLGGSGHMLTINAVTGALINDVVGPSPDEVWYSPGSNRFYGASSTPGTLTVLDGNGLLLTNVPTAAGSHSVAVESVNDHVFVPEDAGPTIGISIFDH